MKQFDNKVKIKQRKFTPRILSLLILSAIILIIPISAFNRSDASAGQLGLSGSSGPTTKVPIPWSDGGATPLGLSGVEVAFPWESPATPEYTWLDVRDVLKQIPAYEDTQIYWLEQYQKENKALVNRGIEILMSNPTAKEAESFIRWVCGLKLSEEILVDYPQFTAVDNELGASITALKSELVAIKQNKDKLGEFGVGVKDIEKTITKADDFRTYDVEIELSPKVVEEDYFQTPVDMVLLIDTSSWMAGENLQHAKLAAKVLANQILNTKAAGTNRVAVVTYGDKGSVAAPFTSTTADIERAIDKITADGSANMQDGILAVEGLIKSEKDILLADSTSIVVHFTDGQVDSSVTDHQGYVYGKNENPTSQLKRWTYSTLSDSGALVAGLETPFWAETTDYREIALKTGILEAQRLAEEGLVFYVVDYSDGESSQLLDQSTLPLTRAPSFSLKGDRPEVIQKKNPVGSSHLNDGAPKIIAFDESPKETITNDFAVPLIEEPIEYLLTDSYDAENFQLVGSPTTDKSAGIKDKITTQKDSVSWSSVGEESTTTRRLSYRLRLKDTPTFPDGMEEPELLLYLSSYDVEYDLRDESLQYNKDSEYYLPVERLLSLSLLGHDSKGEVVADTLGSRRLDLKAELEGREGLYTYQWHHNGKAIGEAELLEIKDNQPVVIDKTVDALVNGAHSFEVEIHDLSAEKADFKALGVAVYKEEIKTTVDLKTLRVVVGGEDIPVQTTITAYIGREQHLWTFLGTGEFSLEAPAGTVYEMEQTVPAGYRVEAPTKSVVLALSSGEVALRADVVKQASGFFTDYTTTFQRRVGDEE